MAWHHDFRLAIQKTASGASLLASHNYVDSLAQLTEAFHGALTTKQVLERDTHLQCEDSETLCIPCVAAKQQLFPAHIQHHPESNYSSSDAYDGYNGLEFHFLCKIPIVFDGNSILGEDTTTASSAAIPRIHHHQHVYQGVNLLLATILYNMALNMHLRSDLTLDHKIALDLYNKAFAILSEPMIVHQKMANNTDVRALLAIILNNKAVLLYENGDYSGCLTSRNLLILCLNTISTKSQKSFLSSTQDISEMYRNGFLLVPPSVAGAA